MLPVRKSSKPTTQLRTTYLNKIFKSVIGKDTYDAYSYDLIISLRTNDISLRALSHFLLITDSIYGRFNKKGFLSYSMSENEHLQASEIRFGSFEIVIYDVLKKLSVNDALYFYLLIKYLPAAIKDGSEIVKNFTESFYNVENIKKTRLERKTLSKELRNDDLLKQLSDEEVKNLLRNLNGKYNKEKKNLKKAAKFASKKLIDVYLKKRNI